MVTVESLIYLIVEYNKNEVLRELNKKTWYLLSW